MPNFNKSPFGPAVKLLYPGVAEYFFGSWKQDVSPTKLYVNSVAIAANVATLGVAVYGGNVPAVGSVISVVGTQQAGGQFNVVNAVLTSVTLNTGGVGTVTFALAATNLNTMADAGVALVPVPEVSEAIAAGASVAVAMANTSVVTDLDRSVTCAASFPTLPVSATVVLQGALYLDDAQFVTLGTIATVATGAVSANSLTVQGNWLFYRALTSGVTGAGTYTVKIEV